MIYEYLLLYPITSASEKAITSVGSQSSKPVLEVTSNLKSLKTLELSY